MTNCLIWTIQYRALNPGSKIRAEWDEDLCWFHYYIVQGDFELHCEQKQEGRWTPLFQEKIRKVKLRKKNKRIYLKTSQDMKENENGLVGAKAYDRSEFMDAMQDIMDNNYNKFKGTNEAELFSREEIADLVEELLAKNIAR